MRVRVRSLSMSIFMAIATFFVAVQTHAQPFPTKTVKIVVPAGPGDGADIMGRAVGQRLAVLWQQPVVIENRAGAGGVLGTEVAVKANPDGYTLLMGNASAQAINQALYAKLPFDVVRDLRSVALLASAPSVLVVNASVPANSVAELIALLRRNPGRYVFSSGGNGTSAHLNAELFSVMAGVKMLHVPYKGANPAINDLIAGSAQVFFGNLPPLLAHIRSGKLRALGITTTTRSPVLPDVPPIADTLPGYESASWLGLFVPAGTPEDRIEKVRADAMGLMALPEIRASIEQAGFQAITGPQPDYPAMVKRDVAKWQRVVQESGATVN